MPECKWDPYQQRWLPREYLRQYYSTPYVAQDEKANCEFARRQFRESGMKFRRAIEVGCGPTLHHALVIAPQVEELDLADYLGANLEEVRQSLSGEAGAHDWDLYASGVLESACGEEAMAMLRARVARLMVMDIREPQPQTGVYDLVASYYCAECVSGERKQWRKCLEGLAGIVAPGGVLLMGALRRCREYHVFGHAFPTTYVDEVDYARELPLLGFDADSLVIETVAVQDWVDQGFESINCIWARKAGDDRLCGSERKGFA